MATAKNRNIIIILCVDQKLHVIQLTGCCCCGGGGGGGWIT